MFTNYYRRKRFISPAGAIKYKCMVTIVMYKVLAHTADVALEVQSNDLETLFIDAAKGWKDVVLEDSETS